MLQELMLTPLLQPSPLPLVVAVVGRVSPLPRGEGRQGTRPPTSRGAPGGFAGSARRGRIAVGRKARKCGIGSFDATRSGTASCTNGEVGPGNRLAFPAFSSTRRVCRVGGQQAGPCVGGGHPDPVP